MTRGSTPSSSAATTTASPRASSRFYARSAESASMAAIGPKPPARRGGSVDGDGVARKPRLEGPFHVKRYSDVPQAGPTQGAPSSRAMSDPTAGDRAPAARPVRRAPTRRRTTGPLSAVDMSGAADVRPSFSGSRAHHPQADRHDQRGPMALFPVAGVLCDWVAQALAQYAVRGSLPGRHRADDRAPATCGTRQRAGPDVPGPTSALARTCQCE